MTEKASQRGGHGYPRPGNGNQKRRNRGRQQGPKRSGPATVTNRGESKGEAIGARVKAFGNGDQKRQVEGKATGTQAKGSGNGTLSISINRRGTIIQEVSFVPGAGYQLSGGWGQHLARGVKIKEYL